MTLYPGLPDQESPLKHASTLSRPQHGARRLLRALAAPTPTELRGARIVRSDPQAPCGRLRHARYASQGGDSSRIGTQKRIDRGWTVAETPKRCADIPAHPR